MTRAHLADLMALMATPPIDFLREGKRSSEFFDENDKLFPVMTKVRADQGGQWRAVIPSPQRTCHEELEEHLDG